MVNLCNLGFRKEIIGETIVGTYDLDGLPTAAPMGIVIESNEKLIIRTFTSSSTYRNIQRTKCAVVNVTSNPELFYLTAFKEVNPGGKLSESLFQKAEIVDAPRLWAADATIEVSVAEISSISPASAELLCNVRFVKALKKLPKVYCRAQFATIESIIHATRIKHFLSGTKNEKKQAIKLLEQVNVCEQLVKRTAPNSCYSEIMADLTRMIIVWRKESESPH
jgi:hypothetical protein